MPRLDKPKEQIVLTAQRLIQKDSYKSVTYEDIANALGIKKASLYHHYRSKEALGLEVIKKYRQKIKAQMDQLDNSTSNPLKKMKNYFRFFVNIHRTTIGMCPAGVLSAEIKSISEDMGIELRDFFNEHISWLTEILENGRLLNSFKFTGDAKDKAFLIESSIQGGLLLARMLNNSNIFYDMLKQIKIDLLVEETWSITTKDKDGKQITI